MCHSDWTHKDPLDLVFRNFSSKLLLLKELWILNDAMGTGSLIAKLVSAHTVNSVSPTLIQKYMWPQGAQPPTELFCTSFYPLAHQIVG